MISEEKQREILRLYLEGDKSPNAIAMSVDCHHGTVKRYIQQYKSQETGQSLSDPSGNYKTVKPVSRGKWDALLTKAEERLKVGKRGKKITVMDICNEIRQNRRLYEQLGLGLDEDSSISYSTVYNAWTKKKKEQND